MFCQVCDLWVTPVHHQKLDFSLQPKPKHSAACSFSVSLCCHKVVTDSWWKLQTVQEHKSGDGVYQLMFLPVNHWPRTKVQRSWQAQTSTALNRRATHTAEQQMLVKWKHQSLLGRICLFSSAKELSSIKESTVGEEAGCGCGVGGWAFWAHTWQICLRKNLEIRKCA